MALVADVVDMRVTYRLMALRTQKLGPSMRRGRADRASVALVTSFWSFWVFVLGLLYLKNRTNEVNHVPWKVPLVLKSTKCPITGEFHGQIH